MGQKRARPASRGSGGGGGEGLETSSVDELMRAWSSQRGTSSSLSLRPPSSTFSQLNLPTHSSPAHQTLTAHIPSMHMQLYLLVLLSVFATLAMAQYEKPYENLKIHRPMPYDHQTSHKVSHGSDAAGYQRFTDQAHVFRFRSVRKTRW